MCSVPSKTVFVGLDYHAASVQVCVIEFEIKGARESLCRNDWRAVVGAVRQLAARRSSVQAAIESCCGAADLADELIAQGLVGAAGPSGLRGPDETEPRQNGL